MKISNQKKIILVIIVSIIFIVLFLITIATKRRVYLGNEYIDKYDVALYLKEYRELPLNYITIDGKRYADKHNINIDNYIIGGDTHWYEEELYTNYGIDSNITLKECDIKGKTYNTNNDGRGSYRLVYTTNQNTVRVFFTDSHYNNKPSNNFVEISNFNIHPTYSICKPITIIYSLFILFSVIIIYLPLAIKKTKNKVI